jgi:hypothetical protein
MAEPEDDIAETLVEGDTYEQASLAVSRMIPVSLERKIQIAVVSLALSGLVAPAILLRRDLLRSLEGTGSLSLSLGLIALNGILNAALGGLLLVRQRYLVDRRSLTTKQARKLIRLEDFFAAFVLFGALFVVASVVIAFIGVVSPPTVEALYSQDVRIYESDTALTLDLRVVSGVGVTLAALVLTLKRLVE